jgi:hypothetical protein
MSRRDFDDRTLSAAVFLWGEGAGVGNSGDDGVLFAGASGGFAPEVDSLSVLGPCPVGKWLVLGT